MINTLVTEGLSYLDTRTDFWRQQKPMYARKHERAQQRNRTDTHTGKLAPNDFIIRELEKIDIGKLIAKYFLFDDTANHSTFICGVPFLLGFFCGWLHL